MLFLVLGIICTFVGIALFSIEGNSGFAIFELIIGIPCLFIGIVSVRDEIAVNKKEQEKEKILREQKYLDFCDKCKKMKINITKPLSAPEKQKVKVLLEEYGFSEYLDPSEIDKERQRILERREKRAQQKRTKELNANRKKERTEIDTMNRFSELTGNKKRIAFLEEKVEEAQKAMNKATEKMQSLDKVSNYHYTPYTEKERDWGAAAGAATAIGGLAAGIGTVMDVERENAAIRERNAKSRQDALEVNMALAKFKSSSEFTSMKASCFGEINRCKREIETLQKEILNTNLRFVSETTSENEVFSHLKISAKSLKTSASGAFLLGVNIYLPSPLIIENKLKALVDGTLKAIIKKNGSKIGEALIVLPPDGVRPGIENQKAYGMGFFDSQQREIKIFNGCEITFEPYEGHLYAIEDSAETTDGFFTGYYCDNLPTPLMEEESVLL